MVNRKTPRWRNPVVLAPAFLSVLHCTTPALANEALARKNDCFGCHSVANKLVGPAYKDVAAKYSGLVDAVEQLQMSICNGSVGKWGDIPMPPHPKLSFADSKKLATWVMSLP